MITKKKMARRPKKQSSVPVETQWDQSLREASLVGLRSNTTVAEDDENTPSRAQYTPGELGQPDSEDKPDKENPQGVQGGRGPLNEEGEGDRQNSQLAELEADVDAREDLERRR